MSLKNIREKLDIARKGPLGLSWVDEEFQDLLFSLAEHLLEGSLSNAIEKVRSITKTPIKKKNVHHCATVKSMKVHEVKKNPVKAPPQGYITCWEFQKRHHIPDSTIRSKISKNKDFRTSCSVKRSGRTFIHEKKVLKCFKNRTRSTSPN